MISKKRKTYIINNARYCPPKMIDTYCFACMLRSVEITRREVAQDADMRQRAKDATPWVGYQCGDKPLKHRCVRPKDAKTGNLVLLDVRNVGNEQDVLLGEWGGQYHLGTVSTREVDASSIVNDASTKSTKSKAKESKSKESK